MQNSLGGFNVGHPIKVRTKLHGSENTYKGLTYTKLLTKEVLTMVAGFEFASF